MSRKSLTGKHILLLLLFSPGVTGEENERVSGKTRLSKMMFLFDKEIRADFVKKSPIEIVDFPEFVAFHYGPYSRAVFDDIEFFINNGYIDSEISQEDPTEPEVDEYTNWAEDFDLDRRNKQEYTLTEYWLTERGANYVKRALWPDLVDNQKSILAEFKRSLNSTSLSAILRYTYLKYPETTGKSSIRGRVLGG